MGPEIMLAMTAFQAIGALSQGNAESASLKSQAAAQEYNAAVQRNNAIRASREASIREDRTRRQAAQFLGRQRAAIAESGTGLGSGSAFDIQEDSEIQAELDALTVRYEGETERESLLQQSTLSTFGAQSSRANARSAKQSGQLKALGTVLGGVGRYTGTSSAAGG